MFAITKSSYRVVSDGMQLDPGETMVDVVPESVMSEIRSGQMIIERNNRLRSTDWTQMPDAVISSAERVAMVEYRQLLRDMPTSPGFPYIEWPEIPSIKDGAAGGPRSELIG